MRQEIYLSTVKYITKSFRFLEVKKVSLLLLTDKTSPFCERVSFIFHLEAGT